MLTLNTDVPAHKPYTQARSCSRSPSTPETPPPPFEETQSACAPPPVRPKVERSPSAIWDAREAQRPRPANCYPWLLLHVGLLVCYSLVFVLSIRHCVHCSADTPSAKARSERDHICTPLWPVVEYEDRVFQGGLWHESPFKGAPRDELEEAWKNITTDYIFDVSASALPKLGKPLSSVQYPLGGGPESGRFMVASELFHQLHCLNLIRKYTYADHYTDLDSDSGALRAEVDHCIDILRQKLMCDGDVGLVTYQWVEGSDKPLPDFSTKHRCRKFGLLQTWVREHKVDVVGLTKPADVVGVPKPAW